MWATTTFVAFLGLQACASGIPLAVDARQNQQSLSQWIDVWTAMPQLTEPANLPPAPYNGSDVVFENATIRQTLQISTSVERLRLRVSNVFGGSDLGISAMTIALPFNASAGVSAIQEGTTQTVLFSGKESFLIPNGALAVSDPLEFPVESETSISVTLYLETGQAGFEVTSHPGSRTTSWMAQGNQVSATNLTGPNLNSTAHWYFLSAVEALAEPSAGSFVVVGDSITDGRGSTTDANNRWTNLLSARLQASSIRNIAVVNQAAGGNRVLADGLGPNALGRIDRDVLSQSGVKYAMIFEGVNDIGTASTDATNQSMIYDRLTSAYDQMIIRIHAHQIPVFGATITPFSGANATLQTYADPAREETRQRVNKWIRESGRFDAVIDFDKILSDPAYPDRLLPQYDSGDYLHPNVAGYQQLADEFPLEVFQEFAQYHAEF